MTQIHTFTEQERPHWRRTFFAVWGGQALSLIGSRLVGFALIWYLTAQTGSATTLAVASLAELLPGLLMGPIAGAIADRFNRKRIMIMADFMVAFFTVVLAILFANGIVEIWHIYVLMFARAFCGSFHYPAMTASTTLLVPREKFTKIQGLNQLMEAVLNILAPPLGALAMAVMRIEQVLLIDIFTALSAVIPLLLVSIPQPRIKTDSAAIALNAPVKQLGLDLKHGFQYIYRWKGLLALLIACTLINFLIMPVFSLTPLLVQDYFGKSVAELGWLQSAAGIGMLAGSILLTTWGGFKKKIMTSWSGLAAISLALLLLGLVPASLFSLSIALFAIVGFGLPIANGPIIAIIQEQVEPEMQGRVFTMMGTAAQAIAPLGLMIAGPFSDRFGVNLWVLLAGIGLLLVAASVRLVPVVDTIETQSSPLKKLSAENAFE